MPNRLADAISPYLRGHADNPVAWHPWGEAAFAEASERDVPVIISIGYATCHWCHVMARESFSDPATAQLMNDGFVSIKVDREEHPDVDATYLAAASAFTRQLGWPLTVFADPSGRAFYAGTYFPPEAVPGVPAFREVLAAVSEAWHERRHELEQTAAAVGEALAAAAAGAGGGRLPDRAQLDTAASALAAEEDQVYGGFGGAPKFPVAPVLAFLAESGAEGRGLARRTLLRMGNSPLRDSVEGGFFRYATRANWSEPHYERMLSDNALLLDVAADLLRDGRASSPTGEFDLTAIADGIVRFLTTVMRQPSGGFASAQDSESVIEGRRDEGGYYRRDAAGRVALAPPALDEKILTGWNGLAIGALARYGALVAGSAVGEVALKAARSAGAFVLDHHVRADGSLVRASLDGRISEARATLEDTGMLAEGLLALAVATGEVRWAASARDLVDAALTAGAEATPASVFAAPGGSDPVLAARGLSLPADPAEGATPSGLTATARAAWLLFALGAGDRYLEAATTALEEVAPLAVQRPIAFGGSLRLMSELASPLVQVVTVVPDGDGDDEPSPERELVDVTRRHEASVAVVVTDAQARAFAEAGFELFEGRTSRDGGPLAYRCEAFVCALPVARRAELEELARA
ncbi:thioredoxin domain-containing protein [Agromyces protaetiae]|uniref:Thioredoxin domain-containing protein n=1 Tax=Agromyces protaetiae TaxID=2509455 RepID=A0A4P6FAW7_9MICO|nr:DUF255 domain-containing protein [Agromyces protaetiae]QAY73370.1 thioredoxin domain-containing protein [Agromyces protaetiae]